MNDDALLRLQFRMRSLSDSGQPGMEKRISVRHRPVVSRFGAAPRSTIDIGVSDVSVRNHSLSLRPPPGRRRTRNWPFQIRPQNDLQHAKNTELNWFYGPPLGIDVRPKPRPDHPRLGLSDSALRVARSSVNHRDRGLRGPGAEPIKGFLAGPMPASAVVLTKIVAGLPKIHARPGVSSRLSRRFDAFHIDDALAESGTTTEGSSTPSTPWVSRRNPSISPGLPSR